MKSSTPYKLIVPFSYFFAVGLFTIAMIPNQVLAAALSINPATGVYTTGKTFTVAVVVNTEGKAINAADGTLSFNPRELQVLSVGRGASIFSLWTSEPTFSNSAGTISFSGGLPNGYTGGAGSVMSVTFKSLTSGTARVSISGGSVLAADGRGTNVLTNMNGGTYTLSAVEAQPAPEVIIEYVAPANTPSAPQITSSTHDDQTAWYTKNEAVLSWKLPAGITGVRTLLDTKAVSVPTKVYENPISTITLPGLPDGVSYFHIQFKNAEGWGKIAHYRLGVDTTKPDSFVLRLPEGADESNPQQNLEIGVFDASSPVTTFKVQIDGKEPFEYIATSSTSILPLPVLNPGYHTVVVEAFDAAKNSIVSSLSFTIRAFEKPVFTDYPGSLTAGVIPVIKGTTKPGATVTISSKDPNGDVRDAVVVATQDGVFSYIPDRPFESGIYTLSAVATDTTGAKSESSDAIKISVEKPGYMVVGSVLVNILSVIIPLIALVVLGWLTVLHSIGRIRNLRARVLRESNEASVILLKEFAHIKSVLHEEEAKLLAARKTSKLTSAEEHLIREMEAAITTAETKVAKEVGDVARLVSKK